MQTFLPYLSYEQSARALDNQRLGKQRVEVLQILKANNQGELCLYDIVNKKYMYKIDHPELYRSLYDGYEWRKTPWYNHPAVAMWRGYEHSLIHYGLVICKEWISRGCKDTCFNKILKFGGELSGKPLWLTQEFTNNHKSILMGKALEALIMADTPKKKAKAQATLDWYTQQFGLIKPADKVNGKWPYIWPERV